MKAVFVLFLIIGIFTLGCTQVGFTPNQINCQAMSDCMMNAIGNDCQSAYGHTLLNAEGNTFTSDVSISKENGTCFFQLIASENGQQIQSSNLLFKNPTVACQTTGYYYNQTGYETTDGECYQIISGMGVFGAAQIPGAK